jgi:hypothetical protein
MKAFVVTTDDFFDCVWLLLTYYGNCGMYKVWRRIKYITRCFGVGYWVLCGSFLRYDSYQFSIRIIMRYQFYSDEQIQTKAYKIPEQ